MCCICRCYTKYFQFIKCHCCVHWRKTDLSKWPCFADMQLSIFVCRGAELRIIPACSDVQMCLVCKFISVPQFPTPPVFFCQRRCRRYRDVCSCECVHVQAVLISLAHRVWVHSVYKCRVSQRRVHRGLGVYAEARATVCVCDYTVNMLGERRETVFLRSQCVAMM